MYQNHQNNQQYQHPHNHPRPPVPSLYSSETHTQNRPHNQNHSPDSTHTPRHKRDFNQILTQNPHSKTSILGAKFKKYLDTNLASLGISALRKRKSKPTSSDESNSKRKPKADKRKNKRTHVAIPDCSIVLMGNVTWIPTESIEGSYRHPSIKRGKRERVGLRLKGSLFPTRPQARVSRVKKTLVKAKGLVLRVRWWQDQRGGQGNRNEELSEMCEDSASFELVKKSRGTIERINTLFKRSAKGGQENVKMVVLAEGEEPRGRDRVLRRKLSFEPNDEAEYMLSFEGLKPARIVKVKEYRAQMSIPPNLSVYAPPISDVQATRKRQAVASSKRQRYIHSQKGAASALRSPELQARLSVKTYVPSGLPRSRSWRLGNRHGPSRLDKVNLPEDGNNEDGDELDEDELVEDELVEDELVEDELVEDELVEDELVENELVEVNLRGGAGSLVDLEVKENSWDKLRSSNSSANSIADQDSRNPNNNQDHAGNLQIARQLSTKRKNKSWPSIKRIISSLSFNQYRGNIGSEDNRPYLKMNLTSQESRIDIVIDEDTLFLRNRQPANKTRVVGTGAESIKERGIEVSSKDAFKCRGLSSNVFATPGEPSTAGPKPRMVVTGANSMRQSSSRLSPQDALKCHDLSANVFATPINEPAPNTLMSFIGIVEETGYRQMGSNFMSKAHYAIQEGNQAVDASAIASARSKPTLNPGAYSDLELELVEAMSTPLSNLPDIAFTRSGTRHAQNTRPSLAINKLHGNGNMDRQAVRSTSWKLVDEPADSLDPGFFEREVTGPSVSTDFNSRAMDNLTQDFVSSSLALTSANGIENLNASFSKPRSSKSSSSKRSSTILPPSMSRSWQTTHLKEEDPVDDEILHATEFDEISGGNKLKETLKAKGASLFSKCTRLARPIKHSALLTTAQAKTLANACARRPSSCLPVDNSADHSDDWIEVNRERDF